MSTREEGQMGAGGRKENHLPWNERIRTPNEISTPDDVMIINGS